MSRNVQSTAALVLSIVAIGLCGYMLGSLSGVSSDVAELTDLVREIQTDTRANSSILGRLGVAATGPSDQARIGQAKADLAAVKQGLDMYQAENESSAYPMSASVNSYEDLRNVISSYVRLPFRAEDVAFTFASYTSAHPDTFVLTARAKDSNRTVITLTPTVIRP